MSVTELMGYMWKLFPTAILVGLVISAATRQKRNPNALNLDVGAGER